MTKFINIRILLRKMGADLKERFMWKESVWRAFAAVAFIVAGIFDNHALTVLCFGAALYQAWMILHNDVAEQVKFEDMIDNHRSRKAKKEKKKEK